MTTGQKVICNGFEGTVTRILDGQLKGMVEVRLPGGIVCVDVSDVTPIGQLVNKLENAIALAVMNGDQEAEKKFTKALEMAVNSTDFPKVSA